MASKDVNFDKSNSTFKKNIYGTSKGKVREAILQRDLTLILEKSFAEGTRLKVLDVGGGQGQLAFFLAALGHDVVLTDISNEMLDVARNYADQNKVTNITIQQMSLQACGDTFKDEFDLVLCHAVFEWLEDPKSGFDILASLVKPNGLLSFMYYNKVGQTLSNLVYGNFEYIKDGMKGRKVVKLNPQSSLDADTVANWVNKHGLSIVLQSGVRCFHDYMRDINKWQDDLPGIIEMELEYSLKSPYNQIGRYTHLILE
ncbi:methyltransferase domain-containing protein [Psychrosphaera ytuae]|uniref:tRNA 5-carboxymethoxyuridine methyltransferase n=1 Tax=Psychrosphaera ytuae TaxID=2820710 RepID=A0A975DCE9_9GAMM|nr:methyltransferase domain-containing protein [Psychrosphaera ytuae]QTH64179.1 methyltransferase domain-containing protein [Psychrosphaera ytuae]